MPPKNRHLSTIPQLCGAMSSQLRHVSTIGKNLLNSNISPTSPYNMVNFGPLAAEIVSLVWGNPANFNGFHVLAAFVSDIAIFVLKRDVKLQLTNSWQRYYTASISGRQPNFAALNRGRHLCSAGRPSGWALAHILV